MSDLDCSSKAKLIRLVSNHDALFNPTSENYKNHHYKSFVWDNIAAEMNMHATKAKNIWRTLRDGYIRHKRHISKPHEPGASRKYKFFRWSPQMSFLDDVQYYNTVSSHRVVKSNSVQLQRCLNFTHTSEQLTRSPVNQSLLEAPSLCTEGSTYAQPLPVIPEDSSVANNKMSEDKAEKILDYLRNKPKKQLDAVDHLFRSYAETFKKFSVRKQLELKVEIAKIFADAEISELKNFEQSTKLQENEQDLNTSPGSDSDYVDGFNVKVELCEEDEQNSEDESCLISTISVEENPIEVHIVKQEMDDDLIS